MSSDLVVLGAGVTGLAAGVVSGAPVIERADGPGGICRSYYVRAGSSVREHRPSEEAFRFEVGGGHWIFGDVGPSLCRLGVEIELRGYVRDAQVLAGSLTIPYPIQGHLASLGEATAARVGFELSRVPDAEGVESFGEWLSRRFGPTLCELFFLPFNERYTAGLLSVVAPEDGYKSPAPADLGGPRRAAGGYNSSFVYPKNGLGQLMSSLAERCDVQYGLEVTSIDLDRHRLVFDDGTAREYGELLSTVPLSVALGLAGISTTQPNDPHTSVLVLNIAAERGLGCPSAHWQYETASRSGFHRVGFYSNVDESFLPVALRGTGRAVSLYVERAFEGGRALSQAEIARYADEVIHELQSRSYIGEVYVLDPSFVEVAYTWVRPMSTWREEAIGLLAEHGVHQVGRYGRWHFQGIADSLREGVTAAESVLERRS